MIRTWSLIALLINSAYSSEWGGKCRIAETGFFEFEKCGETATFTEINNYLRLNFRDNPHFQRMQTYNRASEISNKMLIGGAIIWFADLAITQMVKAICSPSFNPSCNDLGSTTTISPNAYLGYFGANSGLIAFEIWRIKVNLSLSLRDFHQTFETD